MFIWKCSVLLVLVFLHLAFFSEAKCHNYWSGDTFTFSRNDSYCENVIKWPISDSIINSSLDRDNTALSYYKDIYANQYKLLNSVDKKCIGMIQYVACAISYPTCTSDQNQIESVCSPLCEIMKNRCGTSSKLYRDACIIGKTSQKNCSWAFNILFPGLFLIIIGLLY